jgi:hypothetical protein
MEVPMRIEPRQFGEKKHLILVPQSEEESKIIDEFLGAQIPTDIVGEINLSDGYGPHYISLWNPKWIPEGRKAL